MKIKGGLYMNAKGTVFRYGDNVDTDVIIPARYLNTSNGKELATHCMEDIDANFVKEVKEGDLIVADKNFDVAHHVSMRLLLLKKQEFLVLLLEPLLEFFTVMQSISVFLF